MCGEGEKELVIRKGMRRGNGEGGPEEGGGIVRNLEIIVSRSCVVSG